MPHTDWEESVMGVVLHWFLPTNGDSRTNLSLGNAVGAAGSRAVEGGSERVPDVGYLGQIARSAEQLGFTGALTPTSSWCEDAWLMTAALTQVTTRFKYPGDLPGRVVGPALDVAARYADVYLTWGEPPQAVAEKLDAVRTRAKVADRELRFGIWAGVGLVRGGAGTALVGSHEEVAERVAEYYALGIDEFILSGYPHLEEAYQVGEGLIPVLRRRGLMAPRALTD